MLKITAPYMKAGIQDKILYLGFGSIISKIDNEMEQELYLELLNYWLNPRSIEDVTENWIRNGCPLASIEKLISNLLEKKYVIDFDSYNRDEMYSRNHLFFNLSGVDPKTVQRKLKKSHVVILGCGGIGNLISVTLATSGVGKLTLIDDDSIEMSNLTRQFLFTKRDVGSKKTVILKRELLMRSENIEIDTFEEKVSRSLLEKIENIALIVLSADSADCLPLVNQFCAEHKVPYINIGYVQDIAVWGPFYIPGMTGCVYCQNIIAGEKGVNGKLAESLKAINSRYQAPSNGGVNMLSASLGVLDILKFLGGFGTVHSKNQRVGLWTHNLTLEKQGCELNSGCLYCAK